MHHRAAHQPYQPTQAQIDEEKRQRKDHFSINLSQGFAIILFLTALASAVWFFELWPSKVVDAGTGVASGTTLTAVVDPPVSQKDDSKSSNESVPLSSKITGNLDSVYSRMTADFLSKGLDLSSIRTLEPWFHNVRGNPGPAFPRKYTEFEDPLPEYGARLVVVPLEDSPKLVSAAAEITQQVEAILPPSAKVFANPPENYHVTVFHTSHPTDPRANPIDPTGGVDLTESPSDRRDATASEIQQELKMVKDIASKIQAPVLQLERVTMAPTGALLLTWLDVGDKLSTLRGTLQRNFPGASGRQAVIIHSTLLRIVNDEQLSKAVIQKVADVCKEWTAKLKGQTVTPKNLWYVRESQFSTIRGEQTKLPIGK